MNRAIALFVALAMLLAHALAIHDDGLGGIAFPYDQAYVALRLARNLVYDGQLTWNSGSLGFESYPSMAWVFVCAAAERIGPTVRLSTNLLVQLVGIAGALGTLVILSRFQAGRAASLIAPLFLAASGTFAAAAASGLEISLHSFLCVAAFIALERGRSVWFGGLAAASVLLHPLGILFVAAMAAVRAFGRPNDDEGTARVVSWTSFAAPLGVFAGVAVLRHMSTGFVVPPDFAALIHPLSGQWRDGVSSLREFAFVGITPLLLVFPAVWLVLGSLSRTGSHAVFLAICWCALTALSGRSPLPFHVAFAPALPFICLAVQEGMIAALDGVSTVRRRATLFVFGCGLVASAFASRVPGDLGPLPLRVPHEAWIRPSASARFDCEQPLGRLGLVEEVEVARRLRKVGIFLRDRADPAATVLTPWPGSVGYLSRLAVIDVLARTEPASVEERPRSWARRERADVARALELDADYVVPFASMRREPPTPKGVSAAWLEGMDESPGEPARLARIERALERYELITVPIEDYTRDGGSMGREPFRLLRHTKLDARPKLDVRVVEGDLRVGLQRSRMPQLAELELRLIDADDRSFTLRPNGDLDPMCAARARVGLLLYDSGSREVELCRIAIPTHPTGGRWTSATARLLNPGSRGEGVEWEAVSDRATTKL